VPQSAPHQLLPGGDPECFLCRAAAATADRENLVVDRRCRAISLLNRYPYNNGHLLIAPLAHHGRLEELSAAEHLELIDSIRRMTSLIERLMRPEGFNVGLNLGRVAGAGLPGHLHWHVVPRWNGDTNFMPVLAGTRVIPQSLEAAWELLTEALAEH
jgi:ATP adenylyltransferase